jgi:hypothetical protein
MTKRRVVGRYYTPAVHRAAFALPEYVRVAIGAGAQARPKRASKRRKPR